jgi:hypothetical protein
MPLVVLSRSTAFRSAVMDLASFAPAIVAYPCSNPTQQSHGYENSEERAQPLYDMLQAGPLHANVAYADVYVYMNIAPARYANRAGNDR